MAPRKPKAGVKKPNPKQSPDKVTKRGAKGYLTRRDGSINVEPITEAEKDLVETNSKQSPLLKLPAEIRNTIWNYVLGGNDYRSTTRVHVVNGRTRRTPKFKPQFRIPNGMGILRVCRQIYSETASMPVLLNRIIISRGCDTRALKGLTKYQLGLIESLCFEVVARHMSGKELPLFSKDVAAKLTQLKHINLHVFNRSKVQTPARKLVPAIIDAEIAERFAPRLLNKQVDIEPKLQNFAWLPYYRSFFANFSRKVHEEI